jgi:hypothetical protein
MHERFFGHSNAAITSILRNTVNRMGNQVSEKLRGRVTKGPFLTSPLAPRGELGPPGVNFVSLGVKFTPRGEHFIV